MTTKICCWLRSGTQSSSQLVYEKKCLDRTIWKHVFVISPWLFFFFWPTPHTSTVRSSLPICSEAELICMRRTWSGDATAEAQAGLGLTEPLGAPWRQRLVNRHFAKRVCCPTPPVCRGSSSISVRFSASGTAGAKGAFSWLL